MTKKIFFGVLAFGLASAVAQNSFQFKSVLEPIARVSAPMSEITAYMPEKKILFSVGDRDAMAMIDMSDFSKINDRMDYSLTGVATSVSVSGNLVAASILANPETDDGFVQLMRYDDEIRTIGVYPVCSHPDMLTFTPNGKQILVACEGSPSDDFTIDPFGGVAILSIDSLEAQDSASMNVKVDIVGFDKLDTADLIAKGVRSPGNQGILRGLEPEYITISDDGKYAWVSLQENNALARIDIAAKKVDEVFGLGYVDHSQKGFGIDSRNDGFIDIKNVPVRGLRQPDGVAFFERDGVPYIITANEGASIDYKGWTDETTPLKLFEQGRLEETAFSGKTLTSIQNLGVSKLETCPENMRGKCPFVYGFGSRSISIFNGATGELVWDSGDKLERLMAKVTPEYFNWNSKKKKNKVDARSESMGCEPENVAVGKVGNRIFAFVGLERGNGIAVFDVTSTGRAAPKVVDYFMDTRDRGPEGLLFIPAEKSPVKDTPLLVVGYEYSKSISIYKVK
ncbi:MAG: alkaline phosphatase [Fibrobacteraceae bacterium]|nr:alkaline phosphatase [Fibrobacteraceae bacterium]